MGPITESPLLQPANDKREYRCLTLPNDLPVLLISDPETDKAAASMAVNVGYFSDPEDIPGLAHFLEHMLFYSSEKYPIEDSYSIFLNEHGGHSNAYTSTEHTNYHLDVNQEHLEEALDRFAQFFICPLMSPDATNREMNAVDSENSKNLTSDAWRVNQLHKSISSLSHPYHKYGTGNLETLDAGPKARGKDTREELLKFYHDLYSANLMRLVVYGRNSVEELEKMVVDKFTPIKNTARPPVRFPGQPCEPEHLQVVLKVVPVTEGHSLELYWPIPPEVQKYRAAPSRYLGHLIGHEADGSLFALLKSKGWATSLSAGETESSWEYAFFAVSMELTEEGQDHMEDVVGLVFDYIRILKTQGGVAEWIFDEVRSVCETKFHFQDKRPPFQYVTGLALNMLIYPQEDWLVAGNLPREFDPAAIHAALEELTPENLRIVWCSKRFEKEATEVERWYGTKYSLSRLDAGTRKALETRTPTQELRLPARNEFIPTDFSLREPLPAEKYPVMVYASLMSRLWFKADPTFRTPKASVILDFTCPAAYASPETAVLTRIFTKLLVDYLNEHAYYAEIAGLAYNVQSTVLGFQVTVAGYSHKIRLLAEKVVQRVVAFEVREDRFKDIKEKTLKDFLNFQYEQPYQQALYATSVLLEHRRWHMQEYIEVLPLLGPADLERFYPHLLARVFLECYIAGNLTADEATDFVKGVEKTLADGPVVKSRALFASQHGERRIVMLQPKPFNGWFHPTAGLNPVDENSALLFYLQAGQDEPRLNVLAQLFVQTSTRDAFHQLRSVEQLGYIVFLVPRNDYGVQGIQCIVQSNVKHAGALEERVEAFLTGFEEKLVAMEPEDFQMHVDALVAKKEERFKNLTEEVRAYWREVDEGTLMFDRVPREVAALRAITLPDLRNFYGEYVKRGGAQRRKLSSQIYGGRHLGELRLLLGEAAQSEPSINGPSMASNGAMEIEDGPMADSAVPGNAKVDSGNADKKHANGKNGTSIEKVQEDGLGMEDGLEGAGELIRDVYTFKRAQVLFGSLKGRPVAAL